MMDADVLLKRIILPMCFPWCHKSTLAVKNMARDIDELPGILNAGHTQNGEGSMFNGKPRTSKDEEPEVQEYITVSRLNDPGVLNLKKQPPPPSVVHGIEKEQTSTFTSSVGEFKLSSFRESLSEHQRRCRTSSETEVKHVSFRFGGSSSRGTIFPESLSGQNRTLLLEASMSEDLHRGKRIQIAKANEIARELGSYDFRFGLPEWSSAVNSSRVRSGRTRIIWSSKQIGGQRPICRSLLTGQTLENGAQKRPLNVRVCIKLNGKRLCVENPDMLVDGTRQEDLSHNLSNEGIEKALFHATETNSKPPSRSMVMQREPNYNQSGSALHSAHETKVVPRTMEKLLLPKKRTPTRIVVGVEQNGTLESRESPPKVLEIKPPCIACIRTEDGVIRTVCSVPGRISNKGTSSGSGEGSSPGTFTVEATEILRDMADRSMACAVCWSPNVEKEDLYLCSVCGLQVHIGCHPGDSRNYDHTWKCNFCKSYPSSSGSGKLNGSQPPRRCEMCPIIGGALSFREGTGWCHDVCHAWCNSSVGGGGELGQCSICSGTGRKVVRCAARGCSVQFHPMCAVLVSQAAHMLKLPQQSWNASAPMADSGQSSHASSHVVISEGLDTVQGSSSCDYVTQQVKEADALLSMQYDLIASRVGVPGHDRKYLLYLGFCGIHNRRRLPEFYGLPPGGAFYDDAFRIPPLRS